MQPVDPYAYLDRKIPSMILEAVAEVQRIVQKESLAAHAVGAHNDSRMWFEIVERSAELYEAKSLSIAQVIFNATGTNSEMDCIILGDATSNLAGAFESKIVELAGPFARTNYLKDIIFSIGDKLGKHRLICIDDFKHGIHGQGTLKKDQPGTVNYNMTNSPGGVQQTASGGSHQSATTNVNTQIAEVVKTILASDEFKKLNPDQQERLETVADGLIAEAEKPNPDPSKLKKWMDRAYNLTSDFGMKLAVAILVEVGKHQLGVGYRG